MIDLIRVASSRAGAWRRFRGTTAASRRHRSPSRCWFAVFILLLGLAARPVVGRPVSAPTAQHWLGTDLHGRDLLVRLCHAPRVSLLDRHRGHHREPDHRRVAGSDCGLRRWTVGRRNDAVRGCSLFDAIGDPGDSADGGAGTVVEGIDGHGVPDASGTARLLVLFAALGRCRG